jgi:hypothetical protein
MDRAVARKSRGHKVADQNVPREDADERIQGRAQFCVLEIDRHALEHDERGTLSGPRRELVGERFGREIYRNPLERIARITRRELGFLRRDNWRLIQFDPASSREAKGAGVKTCPAQNDSEIGRRLEALAQPVIDYAVSRHVGCVCAFESPEVADDVSRLGVHEPLREIIAANRIWARCVGGAHAAAIIGGPGDRVQVENLRTGTDADFRGGP